MRNPSTPRIFLLFLPGQNYKPIHDIGTIAMPLNGHSSSEVFHISAATILITALICIGLRLLIRNFMFTRRIKQRDNNKDHHLQQHLESSVKIVTPTPDKNQAPQRWTQKERVRHFRMQQKARSSVNNSDIAVLEIESQRCDNIDSEFIKEADHDLFTSKVWSVQ
jgi:hypothetical protein